MGPFKEYCAPATLEEALAVLGDRGGATCILAGGTDVMVRMKRGLIGPEQTTLLGVHKISGLRGVRQEDGELVVGAATTATDLLRNPLIAERAPILARVADRVASAQIRNLATIGGNLANASPAGDLINPLLLLDATLVLASSSGRRGVPVADFFTGPGETVRRPDELLLEVRFEVPAPEREFRFEKAGTRPAMECSVVTVGVAWTPRDGRFRDVRVAFGSSAPVPLRGRETERLLEGEPIDRDTVEPAARAAESEVSPISDIRGSEAYRRVLAGLFLRRLLDG